MGRSEVAVTLLFLMYFLKEARSGLETCEQKETGITRLTGLNSSYVGFLEICRDGLWIPVSYEDDKEWTAKSSIVACKELGFLGSLHIMNNGGPVPPQVSSSTDKVAVGWQYYSVECEGLETHLVDCSWTIRTVRERKKDVMILCTNTVTDGSLVLVGGGSIDGEGVVMMYSGEKSYGWSPICVNEWDDSDAQVVCRQLGYSGGHFSSYSPDDVISQAQISRKRYSHFGCSGSENKLKDCSFVGPYPYKCQSTNYAGVTCTQSSDGNTVLKLNISLLVLMVIISVLLILILLLLLRCTVIKFGKKSSPRRHVRCGGNRDNHGSSSRVVHTELDLEAPYAPVVTIAPPTYAETLLADQMIQSSQDGEIADCSYDNTIDREERSSSAQPLVSYERDEEEEHHPSGFNHVTSSPSLSEEDNIGSSEHLVQHCTNL